MIRLKRILQGIFFLAILSFVALIYGISRPCSTTQVMLIGQPDLTNIADVSVYAVSQSYDNDILLWSGKLKPGETKEILYPLTKGEAYFKTLVTIMPSGAIRTATMGYVEPHDSNIHQIKIGR